MNRSIRFAILILVVLTLVLLNLLVGPVELRFSDIIEVLLQKDSHEVTRDIIFKVRIPEVLTALIVGASLAAAGLVMQTIFRNPLAGPSVLGLSSGASFGAALVILIGLGSISQVAASIFGTLLILSFILIASARVRSVVTLLVFGLMLSYIISSASTVLQFHSQEKNITELVFWSMGSFSAVHHSDLWLMYYILPLALLGFGIGIRPLDAYLLGEEEARGLGINVMRWRLVLITLVSIIVGVTTAYCGPIAFIGLAVPHMARLYFKSSFHGLVLPGSLLFGAAVALVANGFSGLTIFPNGLPLNAVLSFIGAPMVIWLLMSKRAASSIE